MNFVAGFFVKNNHMDIVHGAYYFKKFLYSRNKRFHRFTFLHGVGIIHDEDKVEWYFFAGLKRFNREYFRLLCSYHDTKVFCFQSQDRIIVRIQG